MDLRRNGLGAVLGGCWGFLPQLSGSPSWQGREVCDRRGWSQGWRKGTVTHTTLTVFLRMFTGVGRMKGLVQEGKLRKPGKMKRVEEL